MSTVTLTCINCGNNFQKEKSQHDYQLRQGKENFFCNLSCVASFNNKNNPRTPKPQYGNQHSRKYPVEVSWYATRCFKDRRFGLMEHEIRHSFADHLLEKLNEQNWNCAFTKQPLSVRNVQGIVDEDNPFRIASVDRIDNTLPYQEGNIQWVSVAMNLARSNCTVEDFRNYLKVL